MQWVDGDLERILGNKFKQKDRKPRSEGKN